MVGKTHPYIDALKVSSLIFGALIFMIIFSAGFVASVSDKPIAEARIIKNITPPGRLYPKP